VKRLFRLTASASVRDHFDSGPLAAHFLPNRGISSPIGSGGGGFKPSKCRLEHEHVVRSLDFLGLGGLLHVLEALWRAQLEAAAVVHVPHRLQQHAHFGDPGVHGERHGTGMVERVIP